MSYKPRTLRSFYNPTILFLFNRSSYALQPWLKSESYNVVTVDYNNTDHSLIQTIKYDLMQTNNYGFFRLNLDLSRLDAKEEIDSRLCSLGFQSPNIVISFAPCTDLAVSGAAHFQRKREANPRFQEEATKLCKLAAAWGVPYCVENPVSVLSSTWRKPDHIIHPWEFAGYCPKGKHPEFPGIIPEQDRYNKRTCLWTDFGFKLPMKKPLTPFAHDNHGHVKLGGKSARTKYIRSLTPRGLAQAFYEGNMIAQEAK